MNVLAVLSGSRVYSNRVSGGLSAKSRTQFRVVADDVAFLVGRLAAAARLSRRAFSRVTLSRVAALSLPAAFATTDNDSARTESARTESARAPARRALSDTAIVGEAATDVAPVRAPRQPAKIASSETVPSTVSARVRERRGVTRYLVGILTGARPLQLRIHRNFVSCGSDSNPNPVNVRDGSLSTNALSVKIWFRT